MRLRLAVQQSENVWFQKTTPFLSPHRHRSCGRHPPHIALPYSVTVPKRAPWKAAVWRKDSRAFDTLAFWQAWLDDIRPHVLCAGTMQTAVTKWSHPKDQIFGWLGMTAIDNMKNMRGMDAWSFRAALAQGSVGVGLCWSDGTKAGQEKPLDKLIRRGLRAMVAYLVHRRARRRAHPDVLPCPWLDARLPVVCSTMPRPHDWHPGGYLSQDQVE